MLKRLLIISLLALFILPFAAQLASVSAQMAPATSPITAPLSAFNISGKVTYKRLGRLAQNMQRFMPAPNVLVTIVNFFDRSKSYQTSTDAQGEYKMQVPTGLYQVQVEDGGTFFVPPLRVVRINNENTKRTADFEGLLFNF